VKILVMKHHFYPIMLVLTILLVLTGHAQSAPRKPTTLAELALYKGVDRQQMLEEGARREGKLAIYTTNTERQVVDAFQKKYPFLKVESWRAETAQVASRILEESKAGVYSVDVMIFTGTGGVIMQAAGILQPFASPNLAFIEEEALEKAPDGSVLTAGHFQSGIGIGYNTKLIKKEQLPKSFSDLLDPKWKGKIAIVGSNTGITWMGGILNAYGDDFVAKLAKQNFVVHMVSARALLDMVTNGEYTFTPTAMDSHVANSKKKGAPVDWMPLEPVPSYLGQIMLAKNAPNPYAALLFIDFDLSREAGELYKESGYASPRRDLAGVQRYKRYYGSDSAEQVKTWMAVFSKYFIKK
jgi:iron(III) transport system substrate-binding protein